MKKLKAIHRVIGIFAAVFLIYLAVTGLMIQSVDLRSLITKAPATDPNVEAMSEGFDGPGDYPVIVSTDYGAQNLPGNVDLDAMMQRVVGSARTMLGEDGFYYAELRMVGGKPVGQVTTKTNLVSFDGETGQLLQQGPVPRIVMGGSSVPSLRNQFKAAHRGLGYLTPVPIIGKYIRTYALYINVVMGFVLIVMIVTGIWTYFKLLNMRRKQGLEPGPFWVGGNWKRARHRWVGLVASVFLLVVAVSGEWLSYESLYYGKQLAAMRPAGQGRGNQPPNGRSGPAPSGPAQTANATSNAGPVGAPQRGAGPGTAQPGNAPRDGGGPNGPRRDAKAAGNQGAGGGGGFRIGALTPLKDAEISGMTHVTLNSARQATNNAPIKVIRLRHYVNYQQGVVITGGTETRQIVFNAATGSPMSEAEPGYPTTGFPFGWVAHQTAKSIHRGTYFGLPGRLLDILAALSLLYLCINGVLLYLEMWWLRRKNGKLAPFWV